MKTRYSDITGPEIYDEEKVDNFFIKVMREIGIRQDRPNEFERKYYNFPNTDDSFTVLFYREQPIAVVTITRNERNNILVTFFTNYLDIKKSELIFFDDSP